MCVCVLRVSVRFVFVFLMLFLFTVGLHIMQRTVFPRPFCPSVRLSNECFMTKRKKLVPSFLYHLKDHFQADLPGEPKKIPPTTFVDITAMHGNFCTKFYTIVKRSNIHFITKFY